MYSAGWKKVITGWSLFCSYTIH